MSAKQKVAKLPEKPSALIRLAVRDLEKAERARNYKVDMGTWHTPNGKCRVCFAGAVMAGTLGASRKDCLSPQSFGDDAAKLESLDYFRTGHIRLGLQINGRETPAAVSNFAVVPDYDEDPKAFKRDMRKLATMLAKHGC